jgi:hypothetical protein
VLSPVQVLAVVTRPGPQNFDSFVLAKVGCVLYGAQVLGRLSCDGVGGHVGTWACLMLEVACIFTSAVMAADLQMLPSACEAGCVLELCPV